MVLAEVTTTGKLLMRFRAVLCLNCRIRKFTSEMSVFYLVCDHEAAFYIGLA